jgi:serine/threonine protein kinase
MEAVNQGLEIDKDRITDIITGAVAHIHSLGLGHNDLSPHNIMINDNQDPVIIDMETCMAESMPAMCKIGTSGWSDNWWTSSLRNDEIALERIRLWLNGLYNPEGHSVGGEQ